MDVKKSFSNLHKKIEVTAKTRFYASRRLRRHADWSTYTVVVVSLVMILVALMQAYDIGVNIKTSYTSIIQVFSAIAVLVYSLLIDKNDYSSLSEKMFACASQLSELRQRFLPLITSDNPSKDEYERVQKEYWDILKIYETHSNNDFGGDNLRARLDMPEFYSFSGYKRFEAIVNVYRMHIWNFLSYPVVWGTLALLLKWLWVG